MSFQISQPGSSGGDKVSVSKKKPEPKRGSWIVRMKCVVTKDVYCEGCTEEQARDNPWDYSFNEEEVDQEDWSVQRVEPNN